MIAKEIPNQSARQIDKRYINITILGQLIKKLFKGFIMFRWHVGSGPEILSIGQNLADSSWHKVDRKLDSQLDRQKVRQSIRQIKRQIFREIDIQIVRQIDIIYIVNQVDRQIYVICIYIDRGLTKSLKSTKFH